MKNHITKDGRKIPIKELEDRHLINIVKAIKRKARTGLFIKRYGGGMDSEEIWYDEEVIWGRQVKKALHFKSYKKELKARGLKAPL